ncbi:hypothetical protein [Piscinibacter koreensis]|uniref:DUF1440 domain-containing protein n=1 Tax=Piscinibacter koreensis TaxID=2742824 RepID=A0A7Y6NRJ2_9BURK|nr:hypothetical protein [Schlegelella koreensis]NUZ07974.1 hypothetical protein [Schlegelella koreensis]
MLESLASGILSTALLGLLGRRENGSLASAINAPSHIVWGDEALRSDRADLKHTFVGQALHHSSAFFWGALFEALQARRRRHGVGALVTDAVITTAVAAVVDLKLVPERLTPGFEKRLSRESLAMVYAGIAVGLVLGRLATLRRR